MTTLIPADAPRAHGRPGRGFTLIELLVVIAVISVAASLLLPALQVGRLHHARQVAERTAAALVDAAQAYATQTGQPPASLDVIEALCDAPCPVHPDVFAYGRHLGHGFQIITAGRDGPVAIEAEPLVPGVTGAFTCTARPGRAVDCFPTPGREAGGRQMADAILGEAARLGAGLFVAGAPRLGADILTFVEQRGLDEAWHLLDRDSSGEVRLAEIYEFPGALALRFDGIAPLLEPPLRTFLQAVARHMHLDTLDAAAADAIGATRAGLSGVASDPLYTFAGWYRITRLWVSDAKVAHQLCRILDLAAAADARGDTVAAERHLASFRERLTGQIHRTVTRDHARLLDALLDVRPER